DQLAQTYRLAEPSSASAEAFARQALAEADRAGLRPLVARTQVTLAAALLARRQETEAWSVARIALQALGSQGSRALLVRAHLSAAVAGQAIGRHDWIDELAAAASAVSALANRRFLRAEVGALGERLSALAAASPAAAAAVETIRAA